MKHFYLIGSSHPVCGIAAAKGEPIKEYIPGTLCRLCGMWQQRRCAELVRKYKGEASG